MSRLAGEEAFSRSFMCLGFISAALIIIVQWREISASSSVSLSLNSSVANNGFQEDKFLKAEGASTDVLAVSETRLIVDLSDRQVYFYKNGDLVANYEVAVGRSGWETPTGEFNVINKQTDPVWQHPFTKEVIAAGSGNPLGSRWIGFWSDGEQQIGFHGTNEEDLIGQAVSHGCIRLRETDIQELFELVRIDTPVLIRY
jgi:lipoprotein-anchoring transpeptidase ErfK/SrfK